LTFPSICALPLPFRAATDPQLIRIAALTHIHCAKIWEDQNANAGRPDMASGREPAYGEGVDFFTRHAVSLPRLSSGRKALDLAMSKTSPQKFRKLTREEASKLSVSYSAKRRVDASLTHITKWTKLWTDRQVANIHIAEKTQGKNKTKEAYTKVRQYKDDYSIRYLNVKPRDIPAIVKKAKGHTTQIMAYGSSNVREYGKAGDLKFHATPSIGEGELKEHLDRMGFGIKDDEQDDEQDEYFGRGLLGFSSENPPSRIDIRIRMAKASNPPPKVLAKREYKKAKRSKHSKVRGK
jgi:hypothetical protein